MSWEKSAEVLPEEQFLECVEAAAERWCKKYGVTPSRFVESNSDATEPDPDYLKTIKAFKAGAFYSHDYYSLYWLEWIEKGKRRGWQTRNRVKDKINDGLDT